jgi:hypothetical protein
VTLKYTLAILFALIVFVAPAEGSPITFTDGFEGSSFSSFWSLKQQNGTIQLSSTQSHSGSQSAQLTALGGGQVDVWLTHTFSESTQGTLSVWFFDTGAGPYAGLYAYDSGISSNSFASNVADWAPGYGSPYIWSGPGVGESPTSVARTPGWHELRLEITPTGYSSFVDNMVTGSVTGNFTFDTVLLLVSGPSRTGTFYFDDFTATVETTSPVPEPSTISLLGLGVVGLVRRALKARNAFGRHGAGVRIRFLISKSPFTEAS